jgi:hypothetical protein
MNTVTLMIMVILGCWLIWPLLFVHLATLELAKHILYKKVKLKVKLSLYQAVKAHRVVRR